jgi:hypothetical protein
VLEQTGADALLAVFARARLNDDRLDPAQVQQVREDQSGGTGADDPDLRACHRATESFSPKSASAFPLSIAARCCAVNPERSR